MIQHNLVKFEANERNVAEYSPIPENIYRILRYPKYISTKNVISYETSMLFSILNFYSFFYRYMNYMKQSRGDAVELIMDALLCSGQSSFSNILFIVAKRQQSLKAEGLIFTLIIFLPKC